MQWYDYMANYCSCHDMVKHFIHSMKEKSMASNPVSKPVCLDEVGVPEKQWL